MMALATIGYPSHSAMEQLLQVRIVTSGKSAAAFHARAARDTNYSNWESQHWFRAFDQVSANTWVNLFRHMIVATVDQIPLAALRQ